MSSHSVDVKVAVFANDGLPDGNNAACKTVMCNSVMPYRKRKAIVLSQNLVVTFNGRHLLRHFDKSTDTIALLDAELAISNLLGS